MASSGEHSPLLGGSVASSTEDVAPLLARGSTSPQQRNGTPITRFSNMQWVVYGCFLCLGLGTLLPWNFFITAESYWQYKFRNATIPEGDSDKTPLQTIYTPLQVCLSQIPNFTFLIVNALFSHKLPIRLRLFVTLIAMLLLFTVTTAMVKIPSDSWQVTFFIVTMINIVLLNSSGALFQGGLFGLAGMMGFSYTTAVVTGQAIGGVFASGARIVSLLVGANDIDSAFIYFLIAVGVMVVTLISLWYLMQTDIYRDAMSAASRRAQEGTAEELEPLGAKQLMAHSNKVFKGIWPMGVSVCAVFWVTLAVFPAVCVKIVSNTDKSGEWASIYFQPTLTFLLFNVMDLVGRQTAGLMLWPKRGSRIIYFMVAARLAFIPLLLVCNHTGSSSVIPSVFTSDYAYGIIMTLFAFSNGYCGSICMIYGPQYLTSGPDRERAGSIMAAMLGLGLLLGAATSFGFGLVL